MPKHGFRAVGIVAASCLLLVVLSANTSAQSSTVGNPICQGEGVTYDPGTGQDIVVPTGYQVSVFARDLNFPTGIAFQGDKDNFKAYVIESGTGLPGRCNNNESISGVGKFDKNNPYTPDLLVFDNTGKQIAGPLGKPTSEGGGFQPDGPAIGLAFENGAHGGRLFAADSNQGIRGAPGVGNNTSRILEIDPNNGTVTVLIPNLPTGDHPTEEIVVKDNFIYWSQGSATNSGVTGHDNGAGGNQHDIPCQDVTLSGNVWESGDGHMTAGFSNHGDTRGSAGRQDVVVKAFDGAANVPGTSQPMHACTGAILRASVTAAPGHDMAASVEPYSWGYRNPFGLRFAPNDHPLKGGLFVTENGEDERGARPTNNAPDRLALAQMNADGTPDYHGWPDRFGDLASTQSVFNPLGGPADDLTKTTPTGPDFSQVLSKDVPVRPVLAFPPQQPMAPLAIEAADVAVVQPDFAPDSFVGGIVQKGAALVAREGDFGFSPSNGDPEEGHDIQLVNFVQRGGGGIDLALVRFAFNCRASDQTHAPDGTPMCKGASDQAFEAPSDNPLHGINRPIGVMFGPDGALYLVDYGAVRDFGQSSGGQRGGGGGDAGYNPAHPEDAPLVTIPHTGVIWKITRSSH